MEDGNNTGVDIQHEVLDHITQMEKLQDEFWALIVTYHRARAKLISKVYKYPFIPEYRVSIRQTDEQQRRTMRGLLLEARHSYASLLDVIIKNYEKLTVPRSDNAHTMF